MARNAGGAGVVETAPENTSPPAFERVDSGALKGALAINAAFGIRSGAQPGLGDGGAAGRAMAVCAQFQPLQRGVNASQLGLVMLIQRELQVTCGVGLRLAIFMSGKVSGGCQCPGGFAAAQLVQPGAQSFPLLQQRCLVAVKVSVCHGVFRIGGLSMVCLLVEKSLMPIKYFPVR